MSFDHFYLYTMAASISKGQSKSFEVMEKSNDQET
jgi:hypothetical protein